MVDADNRPRPISRGRRQANNLYLTDLARDTTNVVKTFKNVRKSKSKSHTKVIPSVWSDDEKDPPRKYLEPHDIKIKLYLRECERLNVIPISAYLRHPNKNALKIKHYNIGPNGARALAAAIMLDTVVSYLDIEGNSITPIGLASIQDALSENVYITHLNIADNKLGHQGAQLIGLMMTTNHSIEILNVSHNGFRDSDAYIFAKIIKSNRLLKELVLAGNEFEDEAGTMFGNAIASNETLERFDISWNHIRKKGAAEFALGIKENIALKKLNVSFNGFGTEGAVFMSQALITNRTLLELDISKNRITDIDVKILSKQLSQNETLEVLKIGDNLITALGAMDILKAVLQCETSSISVIDFGSTSVDQGFLMILKELQEVKDVTVTYGKVQNVYANRDMIPVVEKPDNTDENETMSTIGKGKTYIVDEDGKRVYDDGTGSDNEDDVDDDDEFNDENLDNEVGAVTGKAEPVKQEALVTERASVGTLTPDI